MTLLRGGIDGDFLCGITLDVVSPYGVLPQTRREVNGIIDTGAESSCITPAVFRSMKLETDGFERTESPGEAIKEYPTTTVELVLHGAGSGNRTSAYSLTCRVIVASLVGQGFEALIGVDVLSRGEFVANFPLRWWTFAAP